MEFPHSLNMKTKACCTHCACRVFSGLDMRSQFTQSLAGWPWSRVFRRLSRHPSSHTRCLSIYPPSHARPTSSNHKSASNLGQRIRNQDFSHVLSASSFLFYPGKWGLSGGAHYLICVLANITYSIYRAGLYKPF